MKLRKHTLIAGSQPAAPAYRLKRTVMCTAGLLLSAVLTACGGGGGSSSSVPPVSPATAPSLSVAEVQQIIAQGVAEAQARNLKATFAVVDRVGNVLAVYRMSGAKTTVDIVSDIGKGGLDGLKDTIPDTSAAITKAITGAYLSSSGNAFSTRTASQIVQENFNPKEANQPSGPLFGVQFSQLACSDLMRRTTDGLVGPKISPLGLSADAGGLPLYKDGRVVGGIGVMADGIYGLDPEITDIDQDVDELIALASSNGFRAPDDVRANRITADGRTFRYVDSESLLSDPSKASVAALSSSQYVKVDGYSAGAPVAGTAFGDVNSGYMPDSGDFLAQAGWVLTDAKGINRYPLRDGTQPAPAAGGLTLTEVRALLREAIGVANSARAQIRRPTGSPAQVTISVIDMSGEVVGLIRTPDAPVFGTDVSLQKARTAAFFSSTAAAGALKGTAPALYISGLTGPTVASPIANYVDGSRLFFGKNDLFSDGTAISARTIGNIARPTYPDGIFASPYGPLSKPKGEWSPFNDGLQLDLIYNQLVKSVLGDLSVGCSGLPQIKNGIQIFPGGFPIYRGNQLIGAIGVSGDGVDQDDMIGFLGLARANRALAAAGAATPIDNAPKAIRADNLTPQGTRLRYVQCPQAPFNNSTEQNVCAGL